MHLQVYRINMILAKRYLNIGIGRIYLKYIPTNFIITETRYDDYRKDQRPLINKSLFSFILNEIGNRAILAYASPCHRNVSPWLVDDSRTPSTILMCTWLVPRFDEHEDIEVEQIPAEMVRRHHPSERNTLVGLRWKQERPVLFLVIGCI